MKNNILILLVIMAFGIANGLLIVEENEYAIIKRFGEVIRVEEGAGIKIKAPIMDNVDKIPKKEMLYDIVPSTVYTLDKKSMVVDSYITWEIVNPLLYYQTLFTIGNAEQKLSNNTFNAIKSTISSKNQNEVIALRGGELSSLIKDKIQKQANTYGINIVEVDIKRLDLPDTNKVAVYNRMISEREAMKMQLLGEGRLEASKIKNETNREAIEIKAKAKADGERITSEGEAQYMKILASAFETEDKKKFYEFIRTLDALKETIGSDDILVVDESSKIFKLLNGYDN